MCEPHTVQSGIHDQFVEAFTARVTAMKVADGRTEGSDVDHSSMPMAGQG